ncbi:MAG: LysM peptidoglycan-binding domain-containing protein [Chloroflexota bacterium]|nr:LysM peptidoglycan-binding domain-containing protein [Chloroflexota bacterium]
MRNKLRSISIVLFFNLISLSLIFSVVLYKIDFVAAQGSSAAEDDPVLLPRKSEQADDDDGGDDDMGDDDEDDVMVYTVQRGDTLRRIAARLGIPYQVLAAQTDTPSLIYAGQRFFYTSAHLNGESSVVPVAPGESAVVSRSSGNTWEFTVRQGDTLSHIALWLGVSVDELAQQVDDPRRIVPGQKFTYVRDERIDTPPLVTDNDGADSDGYDTDNAGVGGAAQVQQQQVQQRQNDPYTDNDGTDSDGYDTTGNFTDNDGTDSDGIDTTGNFTDNDGTDSDGYDTTGNFTDNDGTDSDGIDTTGQQSDNDDSDDSGLSS